MFRWLVFALGVAALAAGGAAYHLQTFPGLDMPVLIAGFGLLLLASSALLGIQTGSLPAKLVLDNRQGALVVHEARGATAALGYGDIERVGLRFRGRGRVLVALIRANGAFWDLFRTRRRGLADEMGQRVRNFLEQSRRKERTYPALPTRLRTESANDASTVYWKDSLVPRASLWIFAFMSGMALMLIGGLIRAGLTLEIALAGPGAALFLFALYLGYSLIFGERGLRVSRQAISFGFTRGGGWVEQKSMPLSDVRAILYSFDAYGGIPQLLLPDAELLPKIVGTDPLSSTRSMTAGLVRVAGDLRAGWKVFRIALPGLTASEALALEFWLERALRDAGAGESLFRG